MPHTREEQTPRESSINNPISKRIANKIDQAKQKGKMMKKTVAISKVIKSR